MVLEPLEGGKWGWFGDGFNRIPPFKLVEFSH